MALTVFIISPSYSQTIDQFPTGGGGFTLATRLLGKYPGLVSGCALIVDYVLTVAISIASGADAIFSFLFASWLAYRFWMAIAVVIIMVAMNLLVVKESVLVLLSIFLAFVGLHAMLVAYASLSDARQLPLVAHDAISQVHQGFSALGVIGLGNRLLPRLPRTVTGKRTMLYMAASLAFIAGGILVAYLLASVEPVRGKTLNAVLFENLTRALEDRRLYDRHGDRNDNTAHGGRLAVRRCANRVCRWAAGAGDDGDRSLGPAPFRQFE